MSCGPWQGAFRDANEHSTMTLTRDLSVLSFDIYPMHADVHKRTNLLSGLCFELQVKMRFGVVLAKR